MSAPRSHPPVRRPEPAPSRLSRDWRSSFDACTAGARPKSTPVATVIASAKDNTVKFGCDSIRNAGMAPGSDETSTASRLWNDHHARSDPAAPPTSAMIRLSVSSCWIRRARPAPIDRRTAISLVRPAARASSRFATLAHAINRTNPNAASTIAATLKMSFRASGSDSDRAVATLRAVVRPGCSRSICWAITTSSARTCARATPSFRRPTIDSQLAIGSR